MGTETDRVLQAVLAALERRYVRGQSPDDPEFLRELITDVGDAALALAGAMLAVATLVEIGADRISMTPVAYVRGLLTRLTEGGL